jgi:hypothetical protein
MPMIQHPVRLMGTRGRRAREQLTHRQAAGVDHGGERDEHEQHHRHERHDRARRAPVALIEELRHREDAGLQEIRQEREGDDDERDRGHPLIARDRHAHVVRGGARHADELFGGDVGRDERDADQPPLQAAAGEEVGLRVLAFAAALVESERDHRDDERAKMGHPRKPILPKHLGSQHLTPCFPRGVTRIITNAH